jgi:hypothetical protein
LAALVTLLAMAVSNVSGMVNGYSIFFCLRKQQRVLCVCAQETFLESKTGKTGALVLGAGLTAAAFSKELLILHNESVVAGCFFAALFTLYRVVGGSVNDMLSERAKVR